MKKEFYRAFEDQYRGSRTLIKNRLKTYLPFVLPLKAIYPKCLAIDIGCGRGEWLELLKESQIDAIGVDMDEGMLEACRLHDLKSRQGDGIAFLREQADESTVIISAFHVVEHIPFEALQTLIQEALRVLKPGGLLILETPNPENIKVATESFYLDPTHTKPIPSALLSFLTKFYGYARTKTLRMQEPSGLSDQLFASLGQVMEGVSPDYAIIAQKDAPVDILNVLDSTFSQESGLSFAALSEKFELRMQHFEKGIQDAASKVHEVENRAIEAENRAIEAENKILEAEAKTANFLQQYNNIINSNSWKLTKPLRFLVKVLKRFLHVAKNWLAFPLYSYLKSMIKSIFFSLKNFINRYPKFKMKLMMILRYTPIIKSKFKEHNTALIKEEEKPMSPRAEQIYSDLQKTIKNKRFKK